MGLLSAGCSSIRFFDVCGIIAVITCFLHYFELQETIIWGGSYFISEFFSVLDVSSGIEEF